MLKALKKYCLVLPVVGLTSSIAGIMSFAGGKLYVDSCGNIAVLFFSISTRDNSVPVFSRGLEIPFLPEASPA